MEDAARLPRDEAQQIADETLEEWPLHLTTDDAAEATGAIRFTWVFLGGIAFLAAGLVALLAVPLVLLL